MHAALITPANKDSVGSDIIHSLLIVLFRVDPVVCSSTGFSSGHYFQMPSTDIRVDSVLKRHFVLLPIAFKAFRIILSNHFNRGAAVNPWPIIARTTFEPFLSDTLRALEACSVICDGPSTRSICDPVIIRVEFSLPENFEGET